MRSGARANRAGGMVSPKAWALSTFMIRSRVGDHSAGRSADLAPFRILSTLVAALVHIRHARGVAHQGASLNDGAVRGSHWQPAAQRDLGQLLLYLLGADAAAAR
jgi:hypothetical protein